MVKSTKPTTLLEAMERARDLQHTLPKARALPQKGTYSGPKRSIFIHDLKEEGVARGSDGVKTFFKKEDNVVPSMEDFSPRRGEDFAPRRGAIAVLRVLGIYRSNKIIYRENN